MTASALRSARGRGPKGHAAGASPAVTSVLDATANFFRCRRSGRESIPRRTSISGAPHNPFRSWSWPHFSIPFTAGEIALTFDDVLLKPGHSEVMPSETDVRTRLTRGIELKIPLLSSAMDTLGHGGAARHRHGPGRRIGVIHGTSPPRSRQSRFGSEEVRERHGRQTGGDRPRGDAARRVDLMKRHTISGIPVVENAGRAAVSPVVWSAFSRTATSASHPTVHARL